MGAIVVALAVVAVVVRIVGDASTPAVDAVGARPAPAPGRALAVPAGRVDADQARVELVRALDVLLTLEMPGGGWTYAHLPGSIPRPLTEPVRFADWVERRLGLSSRQLLVVRSPGTPAGGLALLAGYRATGRAEYLAAARRAGDVLLAVQLVSDGWFSEAPVSDGEPAWWFHRFMRRASIDDDVTPGAVRFLTALWAATGDRRYRFGAERGIDLLLRAQLADGAWPLVLRPAWKRLIWRTYEDEPTLNDGATPLAIRTLLDAAVAFARPELRAAAERGGAWLLRVQGDPPRAGWAQQYDVDGTPRRARRWEKPGLATWESRHAVDALVALAAVTDDDAYCAAVRRAATWLGSSTVGPGCWPRLVALADGAALYFDDRGRAVASAAAAHHPYDWVGEFGITEALARLGGEPAGPMPIPGDPGECNGGRVAVGDVLASGDARAVIAYAGKMAEVVDGQGSAACVETAVAARSD